jgi:hypothetical protein
MTAVIVIVCILAVIVLGYFANVARLARKNNNLTRKSTGLVGRGGADVDEHNRTRR